VAEEYIVPWGTVVGLVYREGVVLAAERRVAFGRFVVSRAVKKVFKVNERVGAACAGMVGDMQVLVRQIQAIGAVKQLETSVAPSAKGIAKLMSNLMFALRLTPLFTQVIVGGFDGQPQLYILDPIGSVIPDLYAAVGSGAEVAMGVLEAGYRKDLTEQDAVQLAIDALKAASRRDAASGDGADILIITKDSIKEDSVSF
jgi:proteasome beta subunit